jgi:hypothetical protein
MKVGAHFEICLRRLPPAECKLFLSVNIKTEVEVVQKTGYNAFIYKYIAKGRQAVDKKSAFCHISIEKQHPSIFPPFFLGTLAM